MSTESNSPKLPKPPPLLMERLSLGELSADQERALREQFGDEIIDQGLRLLQVSDETLRAAAAPMVSSIERRVADQRQASRGATLRRLGFALTPALAAAAAVYLAIVPQPPPGDSAPIAGQPTAPVDEPLEQTRIKGDPIDPAAKSPDAGGVAEQPSVLVYRRVVDKGAEADPTIEQLKDGSEVRAGDVLQMGYSSPHRYGALLSLDGRGQVTLHFPADERAEPKLARSQALLDFAYELDDSPAFERFFLVSADASFSVTAVVEAARKLGTKPAAAAKSNASLVLAPGLHVTSLTLDKVAR